VKAVVLVGGQGTRLRPLTLTTPKPLLPIANVPFLERQLAWLGRHGVDEVVLSLGYLPERFMEHFSDDRFNDIKLRFVVEHEPLGTAGGIRFAAEGIDERILVCNGDVLTDLDLGELLAFHDERSAAATIALTRVGDPSAFGVVPTRADGAVIAFVEKPPDGQAPTSWINAGTYVLEPEVIDSIPPRLTVSIERETFPRMLEVPGRLYAMRSDAYWLDIGTPRKFLQAQHDVARGMLGLPPVPGATERWDGVWVEPGAEIDPGAAISGPGVVGVAARVGAGARVEASMLGPRTTVGEGSTVLRSVLLPGTTVAPGASVIDEVVGPEAVLPCGLETP
jgi:NDP-sugar pyrophosphorylase family protein